MGMHDVEGVVVPEGELVVACGDDLEGQVDPGRRGLGAGELDRRVQRRPPPTLARRDEPCEVDRDGGRPAAEVEDPQAREEMRHEVGGGVLGGPRPRWARSTLS